MEPIITKIRVINLYEKIKILMTRWLKITYLIIYLNVCFLIAYLHLIKNKNNYTQQINLAKTNVDVLKKIANFRGIHYEKIFTNRSYVEQLIHNSGIVYEAELINSNLSSNQKSNSIVFNSAGEFLESVEDSKNSVWLVQIVMKNEKNKNHEFLTQEVWRKLINLSNKIGILTGSFNCENDVYFCQIKDWHVPQLVLGLVKYDSFRHPKEFVELFYYNNQTFNKYEDIVDWIEIKLKSQLKNTLQTKKHVKRDVNNFNTFRLNVYYLLNEKIDLSGETQKVPLFFYSLNIKYSRGASFHLINSNHLKNRPNSIFYQLCFNKKNKTAITMLNTPIFFIINNKICYNYGSNINEFPNYQNLNQFLIFLNPDINNIFLINFFFLNFYLVLFFFEYDDSFFKQLIRGLVYFCVCNFLLFSISLFPFNTNSKEILKISLARSYVLNKLLYWFRHILMYNTITQTLMSNLRFYIYFFAYIKPLLAGFIYFSFCLIYYFHSRSIFFAKKKFFLINQNKNQAFKQHRFSKQQAILNNENLLLKSFFLVPVKHHNSDKPSFQKLVTGSPSNQQVNQLSVQERLLTSPSHPVDIDIEISVTELINQINGLTTIWLQSSTYADRLLNELPTLEYCKCFFINKSKFKSLYESDSYETSDDDNFELSKNSIKKPLLNAFCECGKNNDLKRYLNKNDFNFLWSKFSRYNSCSICLENYIFGCMIAILPCGHLFHRKCINEWFLNSVRYECPVCRTSFYKFKNF